MKRLFSLLLVFCLLFASGLSEENLLFGSYYQTPGTGAAEPIRWIVLRDDGDALLLISEHVLDCRRFHDSFTATCWANCDLRAWLNAGFYDTAFTDAEKERILPFPCEPHPLLYFEDIPQGEAVSDHVFLLSAEEAALLLVGTPAAQASMTGWAKQNCGENTDGFAAWWLRTVSFDGNCGTAVTPEGEIAYIHSTVNDGFTGVRPCILLKKN